MVIREKSLLFFFFVYFQITIKYLKNVTYINMKWKYFLIFSFIYIFVLMFYKNLRIRLLAAAKLFFL